MNMIVAVDNNWAIGCRNSLLVSIPADHKFFRQELISGLGAEVERAENGKVCVEKFERSEKDHYDAILMDIRMPVMTGYEATRAIRALEREDARKIPIIAMSADAFSDDVKRSLESGMNAHVAKPIDMDELAVQLEKNLRKRN